MGKNFNTKAYTSPTNIYMNNGSEFAGECTTYVWGRAYEKLGYNKMKNLPNKMAGSWYDADHGYSRGQIPEANSVGCFSGHVVFIERVSGDGKKVYFSEANWYNDKRQGNGKWYTSSTEPKGTDGSTKSLTVDAFKAREGGGYFQGFIYLV